MTRATYVFHNGEVVDKRFVGTPATSKRRYVISDTMDPLRHPITGKLMDSKSEFRKVTRAHGCTEVGNDKWADRKPIENPPVRPDLMRAIEQLRNR